MKGYDIFRKLQTLEYRQELRAGVTGGEASENGREVTQLCPTLCDPMDCSLPGSSIHGKFHGCGIGVGCHFLLQGIFPTQGLNLGLPHCRQTLYPLSHQGSPRGASEVVDKHPLVYVSELKILNYPGGIPPYLTLEIVAFCIFRNALFHLSVLVLRLTNT